MSAPKTAFVTGGGGGIGAAICEALAEAGHRVAVADLDASAAERVAVEIDGFGVDLDVTLEDSVAMAFARAERELGTASVCVNCAGWDEMRPFLEVDDELMDRILEVNLAGPMRVARRALPAMVEAGWGRIINIASDAGRVGSSLEAVYSGAKGGLIAFTKTLAREMARHGITANAVCPGPTDTPMLRRLIGEDERGRKVIDAMTRGVPLRRLGRPEDVAPAVVFLASEAAGYITGQTLSVSGGLTMA